MDRFDLKQIRAQSGNLSQTKMAERLGITLRTYQNYEHKGIIPVYMEKLIAYEFLNNKQDKEEEVSEIKVRMEKISFPNEVYKEFFNKTLSLPDKEKALILEQILYRLEKHRMNDQSSLSEKVDRIIANSH